MADRVRRDKTPARGVLPGDIKTPAHRTSRPWGKLPGVACTTPLQHQPPLATSEPERRVVLIENRTGMRAHRRSTTAPAGSVTAPHTNTDSQPSTWFTAVPRS